MSSISWTIADFPFEFLHSEAVSLLKECDNVSKLSMEQTNTIHAGRMNVETKLEYIGFRVGYALVERLSRDFPRFTTELDCMKFICKEFWFAVFKRQVDNLRTNHHGVYVIQDAKFHLLTTLPPTDDCLEFAALHLAFTCGLIRGSLSNLGFTCLVTAEVQTLPAVKFSVSIQTKV